MASTCAPDSAPARSAASVAGSSVSRADVSNVARAAPTVAPETDASQAAASRCAPACFHDPVATTCRAASALPPPASRSSSPKSSTTRRRWSVTVEPIRLQLVDQPADVFDRALQSSEHDLPT